MRVLLGITGGIAAFKAASLIRLYSENGHQVRVIASENALRFIGEPTLAALSGNRVYSSLYEGTEDVPHIELAKWADIVVVAPATAAFLARYAHGLSDDLLTNVLLATTAPVFIAPAMHTEMWQHPATEANIELLIEHGVKIIDPGVGRLTGSDSGAGRLAEPEEIFRSTVIPQGPLSGLEAVVTAGGTREPIDSVRFIGNRSSGKQGVAFAIALRDLGAKVTLIAANLEIAPPGGVEIVPVSSFQQLRAELDKHSPNLLVMTAAVSDFSVSASSSKLERKDTSLELTANPDLLAEFASSHPDTTCLGFAAQTVSGDELVDQARAKLGAKGIDWIVANDISGDVFGSDSTAVSLTSKDTHFDFSGSKMEVAQAVIAKLVELGVLRGN